ncbi:unnamed protein product [Effrenium voratum]|nr:unnamed protein product [Effrenium voratum]
MVVTVQGVDVIFDEDDGLYTYINEQSMDVSRTTLINDPDTTISADQNDRVHQAALRQISRPGDNAVRLSGARGQNDLASHHGQVDLSVAHGNDDVEMEDEGDDDDDYALNPQPFARLFQRMGLSNPKKRAAGNANNGSGPTSVPVKRAKADQGDGGRQPASSAPARNKAGKTKTAKPPDAPANSDGDKKDEAMTHDDNLLIDSYEGQFSKLKLFNNVGSDDASFGVWAKARMTSLSDLKGIQAKRKSLARRKGDLSHLKSCLDSLISRITTLSDFVKQLVSGTTEGRSVYETLVKLVDEEDLEPPPAMWQRCLRAYAFEDLKLAQWQSFFGETQRLCFHHLGEADGRAYLVLLSSQLLQRLVKGHNGTKITVESLGFVKGFVDALHEHLDTITGTDDMRNPPPAAFRDEDAITAVQTMLDFTAPPGRVLDACKMFIKSSEYNDHWAIQAFNLDKGRKIVEAARENAKKREAQSTVLESIAAASASLHATYLTHEAGEEGWDFHVLTAECGHTIVKAHKAASGPGMKAVKGADKDLLLKLQADVQTATRSACVAFVSQALVPFLQDCDRALRNRSAIPDAANLLTQASCVRQLQNVAHTKLVDGLLKFTDFFANFRVSLEKAETLAAEASQSELTAWQHQSAELLAKTATPASPIKELLRAVFEDLSEPISRTLQGRVDSEASDHVEKCISFLNKSMTNVELSDDDMICFVGHVEQLLRMSSVLCSRGDAIRAGVCVVEATVRCNRYIGGFQPDALSLGVDKLSDQTSKAIKSIKNLDKKTTQADLLGLLTSIKFNEGSLNFTPFSFASQVNDTLLKLELKADDIVKAINRGLAEQFSRHEDVDTSIPDDISGISEVQDAGKLKSFIQKTFQLQRTKDMADHACDLEALLDQVRDLSKKTGVACSDLCEFSKIESKWRSCLCWMQLA